jgi:hypothetical protein
MEPLEVMRGKIHRKTPLQNAKRLSFVLKPPSDARLLHLKSDNAPAENN